jgi:putative PIN family toxin of toxin-antitoxin system
VRAVLDANVLVSAVLSKVGTPALLIQRWLEGEFELVVCERLLAETAATLARPKLHGRIDPDDAADFVALVREFAEVVPDPDEAPPIRSTDPSDNYLLAVAAREKAPLVSGDQHLLMLRERAPVLRPREFHERLD